MGYNIFRIEQKEDPPMSYKIITDSTIDMSKKMADSIAIDALPLLFTIDGEEYKDNFGVDMDPHIFYEKVRTGQMPTTTLINTERFLNHFQSYLEHGIDVVYIAFSSQLSGTCQCAMQAAAQLKEEFPERHIFIIDSLCASMGEGLLVYQATRMRDQGMGAADLADWLEKNKKRVVHWFTVDDINHLRRGGRVSAAQALLGSLMKIKPVMHVDDEGRLVPMEKVLGRKKALSTLVEKLVQRYDGTVKTIFVSHGDVPEEAADVEQMIKAKIPDADIHIHTVGPVVGAHSGPGTMAVFCFGSPR
jgi:DegV family protein with EDD domain